jgi:hypothetical protein
MQHSRDVPFRLLTRGHNQEMMPSSPPAVEFAAPRQVRVATVALPEPGPNEVVVTTHFSAISGGTELLAYRGEIDPAAPLDDRIESLDGTFTHPFRYGYACVGEADGQPVFAFHPHQNQFVARRDELVPLPAGVDLRQATLFPLVETALQIALDAGPVLGDKVVVLGLGAVGALTALLLQRGGARTFPEQPPIVGARRKGTAALIGLPAHARGPSAKLCGCKVPELRLSPSGSGWPTASRWRPPSGSPRCASWVAAFVQWPEPAQPTCWCPGSARRTGIRPVPPS